MTKLKTAWDFVEKYYPNYDSSNEILENDDLLKLVEDNPHDEEVYNKWLISNARIFEDAINNFIKQQNN